MPVPVFRVYLGSGTGCFNNFTTLRRLVFGSWQKVGESGVAKAIALAPVSLIINVTVAIGLCPDLPSMRSVLDSWSFCRQSSASVCELAGRISLDFSLWLRSGAQYCLPSCYFNDTTKHCCRSLCQVSGVCVGLFEIHVNKNLSSEALFRCCNFAKSSFKPASPRAQDFVASVQTQ